MKTLLISLIFLMAVVGCDYDDIFLQEKEIEVGNIYDYDFKGSEEIPKFETIEDAANWMKDNIVYKYDKELFGKEDYWQTPEEFFYNRNADNKMQGDCEDFALFFSFLANKFNFIINIYDIEREGRHSIAKVENWNYDFSENSYCRYTSLYRNDKVIHIIPYSEALWMAVNYHDNVGKYK